MTTKRVRRILDEVHEAATSLATTCRILLPMTYSKNWLCLLGLAICGLVHAQTLQAPQANPKLMPNAAQGKRLFEKHCASCHGMDLKGSDKGPPFLHPVYEPSHHGDAAFQMAVKNGSRAHHWRFGDMPPVLGVSPDEVVHITAYVRQVQRQNGIN